MQAAMVARPVNGGRRTAATALVQLTWWPRQPPRQSAATASPGLASCSSCPASPNPQPERSATWRNRRPMVPERALSGRETSLRNHGSRYAAAIERGTVCAGKTFERARALW